MTTRQRSTKPGGPFSALWRYLLLLPVTLPVGVALFVVAWALMVVPPIGAVILFIEGHWAFGVLVVVAWALAMYWLRHVYARLFEGSGGL